MTNVSNEREQHKYENNTVYFLIEIDILMLRTRRDILVSSLKMYVGLVNILSSTEKAQVYSTESKTDS